MAKKTSSRAGWWQLSGVMVAVVGATTLVPACGSDSSGDTKDDSQRDGGADGPLLPQPSPYMTLSIDPPSVPADGTSTATITVKFRNPENNQPWKGQQVVLTSTGKGGRIVIPNNVTNDDGVVTATISSTVVEGKTITAQVGSYFNSADVGFTGCKSALFVPLPAIPSGRTPGTPIAADFNRDGKADIAFAPAGGPLTIWLSNGDGTFTSSIGYQPPAKGVAGVASGDLNGDGKVDVAVTLATSDNNVLTILRGKGDGGFERIADYAYAKDVSVIQPADYNGDGKLDLVTMSNYENSVAVRLGNGDGTFQNPISVPVAQQPTNVTSGDFNGDNKLDLAVITQSDRKVSILLGNGDGTFQSTLAYDGVDDLSRSSVADVNADGKLDLVIANYNNDVGVLLGNGNGSFAAGIHRPLGSGAASRIADLDGDGKLDLLVHYYEESYLSLLFGTGDGKFPTEIKYEGLGAYQMGGSAIADFTGDDRADFALMMENTINVFARTGCTR